MLFPTSSLVWQIVSPHRLEESPQPAAWLSLDHWKLVFYGCQQIVITEGLFTYKVISFHETFNNHTFQYLWLIWLKNKECVEYDWLNVKDKCLKDSAFLTYWLNFTPCSLLNGWILYCKNKGQFICLCCYLCLGIQTEVAEKFCWTEFLRSTGTVIINPFIHSLV